MEKLHYEIGRGRDIYVGYRAEPLAICVQQFSSPGHEGPIVEPARILNFRPFKYSAEKIGGQTVAVNKGQEPPGWFERKCHEANCEWFVPMVKRMADGEDVPLEEIQAAYLKHNGQPMPCGEWNKLFR